MKNKQTLRKFMGAATALAVSVSVFAGGTLPATANSQVAKDSITHSGTGGAFAPGNLLPLVETQLGLGAVLRAGVPATVDIPNFPSGSALVRLSVLSPQNDLVLDAVGVPALSAPAGISTSTTVLVPVVDGKFALSSTQDTDVRVELISTFTDGELGNGGTKALLEPEVRADSARTYGLGTVASETVGVSVVGVGEIPSTGVRAAYVTVVTEPGSNATLTIDGAEQRLGSGVNVINTIANVSELGTVEITSNVPDTKVYLRGYVRGALQNEATQTIDNGFNVSVGAPAVNLNVKEGNTKAIDIGAPSDATHVLVAVAATSASEATFLQIGKEGATRGKGVITSPREPTNSQLVLAELDDQGQLPVAIRFGSAEVSLRLLGALAGDATRPGSSADLTINSPQMNAVVDLRSVGTFTATGVITTSASSLDKVEVKANGELVGTAQARRTATGYDVSFQTSVPTAGDHTLEFIASFRDGVKADTKLSISVQLPEATDTVISEDTVVQYGEDAVPVLAIADDSILYAQAPDVLPGQILVGRDSLATEGYLRRVVSIESAEGGVLVHTEAVALTDVFLQADVSEQVGLITEDGTQLFPVNTATPSDVVVDTNETPIARSMPNQAMSRMDVSGEVDRRIGQSISIEALLSFETALKADVSNNMASHSQKKSEIKAGGGIQLSGESRLSVALVFELKVSVEFGWFQSPKAKLDKFKVAVERTLESTVGANSYGSFEASWSKRLAKWNIGTVTFMLGPVPVVITTEAEIGLIAKISAEVKSEIKWTGKESQQYGFELSNGQLHAVSPWPPVQNAPISIKNGYTTEEAASVNVKGEVSASVGPELEFKVSIYDAAGPVVKAGALFGISAAFENGNKIEWAVFLEGTIGIGVRLEVPIIDAVLLEATVMPEMKRRWELLNGSVEWNTFWQFGPEDPDGGEGDGGDDGGIGLDPIEIPEYSFDGSSLRATLYWDNSSDLDLHVQEPNGEWISYNNPGPSATGGFLDIDAFAACSPTVFPFEGGLENVTWQVGSQAKPGQYRIEVDEWSRCGFDAHAKWVLKVYVDEKLRFQQSGNSEQQFTFNLQDPAGMRSRMAPPADVVQEMQREAQAHHPEGVKTP